MYLEYPEWGCSDHFTQYRKSTTVRYDIRVDEIPGQKGTFSLGDKEGGLSMLR